MTNYLIYNEDGELMRVVHRQEESIAIVSLRTGWSVKRIRTPKPIVDLSQFKEALF